MCLSIIVHHFPNFHLSHFHLSLWSHENLMLFFFFKDFQPVLFGTKIANPETSYSSLCLQISATEVMESYQNHDVSFLISCIFLLILLRSWILATQLVSCCCEMHLIIRKSRCVYRRNLIWEDFFRSLIGLKLEKSNHCWCFREKSEKQRQTRTGQ